ncbi:hypothetical protein ACFQ0K_05460 [Nocardioides caeni]|uniref:Copper chaperone PCu(A)C n=1 Tax=Nocardioides caeni TaxID=574700 RepID=A0A4S8N7G9_9ACTN|nr:hypothetical protein [Nocardioides caeni]THV12138.1 hypothetical protein E9934_12375 [Nocardioides caeni]
MHHLRPTAIAGLLMVLVPSAAALSSCGFDYPTDRVSTIAAGQNNRDASVDALGIRVLATATGEGRLIGSLANNLKDPASLVDVSGEGLTVNIAEPIEVAGRGGVNLVDQPQVSISGKFTAGDVIDLVLTFDTDETISLEVPVVKPCFQYSEVPTEAAEEGAAADAAADEELIEQTGESESAHGEESGDATFVCDHETPHAEEGGH